MNIEQGELEREMVPIVARCFRGCGTRAVLSDGFSNFCACCLIRIGRVHQGARAKGLTKRGGSRA